MAASRPLLVWMAGALVVSAAYSLIAAPARSLEPPCVRSIELSNMARTYAVGALVYPILWYALVGPELIRHTPWTLIGLVWPLIIICLDLTWVTKQPQEPDDTKKTSFTFDGNAISGMSFALGGLLVSQVGEVFSKSATPMLSACIFLVICFVIPHPGVHVRSGVGAVILGLKKIGMAFATGLLLSAIAVSLQAGLRARRSIRYADLCTAEAAALAARRGSSADGVGVAPSRAPAAKDGALPPSS